MSKAVQALLSGIFFTFILDFFLFLGIFENYIKVNGIDLYYNILFSDNQSFVLFFILSIILGYITLYKSTKLSLIVLLTLSVLSLSTLIAPIGNSVGSLMFTHKNVRIQMQKFSYQGDILYEGRKEISFYDYKFKKILQLQKNKILGNK